MTLGTMTMMFSTLQAEGGEPFSLRYKTITKGDIAIIGNTLMTAPESKHLAGQPYLMLSNDEVDMVFVDVDSDDQTQNSSAAILDMPDHAEVLFARLYWGARSLGKNDSGRGKIKFAAVDGSYITVKADRVSSMRDKGYYAATADVTDLVKRVGKGQYVVADIDADTGMDMFAGWSLVVVYTDDSLPQRFLSLYDGFVNIPPRMEITIDGFKAPIRGSFSSTLGVVAFDGEMRQYGDFLLQNGQLLSDQASPENNFFNSGISNYGMIVQSRNPDYLNTMGIDIKMVDVCRLIKNAHETVRFTLTASDDAYLPVVVTFATDNETNGGNGK